MVRFCFFFVFVIGLMAQNTWASSKFTPFSIIKTHPDIPHILIAEKSTHKMYLYQLHPEVKLIKTLPMTTGLNSGDKQREGDKKTPEGIYFFSDFLSRKKLEKRIPKYLIHLYGRGAFTSDYPNAYDRSMRKTGGGIWLHSSDDPKRVLKKRDTRGCPIVPGDELLKLKEVIKFNKTPIVIVKDLHFWPTEKLESIRSKLFEAYKKKRGLNKKIDQISIFTHENYAVLIEKEKTKLVKTYFKLNKKYQWRYLSQKKHRIKNNELH